MHPSYQLMQAHASEEGGIEVGQTLWFLEALWAKTNLFWREMKNNKMYTEIGGEVTLLFST